jgi:hyperosmotically inducible protein
LRGPSNRAGEEQISDSEYGVVDASRDVWITSMVKMRLMADGETLALDINIDTRDGVVTLFGMVPTAKVKDAAEVNVRKVDGGDGPCTSQVARKSTHGSLRT